jgi:hypothetical protein
LQFTIVIGQPKKNKNNTQKTTIAPVFVVPTVDPGEIDDQSPEFHKTPYELSNYTKTATYDEAVNWYKKLHRSFPNTELLNIGNSDAGLPIFCFHILPEILVMNAQEAYPDGSLEYKKYFNRQQENPIKLLINNNIHPGEPEGTDASMLFARDFLTKQLRIGKEVYRNVDIYIIVQYNVDGTINRSGTSRVNQDGPIEYGFRGNAKNLDLNRDFIKMDSRNAKTLVAFMAKEKFDYFIDNHTSNGADYQYTLTYFHTRVEKLPSYLVGNTLLVDSMLKLSLKNMGYPTSPYVNTMQEVPDSGLVGFYELPRFATGWAALNHTIGFTVETHMLKPFNKRVDATKAFLDAFLGCVCKEKVIHNLAKAKDGFGLYGSPKNIQYTHFKLDQTKFEMIDFLGYEFGYKPSAVSGFPRLYYDRSRPKTISLKYYNHYIPIDSVEMPIAYILPYAYKEVLERLELNDIKYKTIIKDTVVLCKVSYILDFNTVKDPYEGHYLHSQVKTKDTIMKVTLRAGDKLIFVNDRNSAFLSATLEPKSPDSYFCWNFFDGILQQKEGYSAYVFEDKAAELLAANPQLRKKLELKRNIDSIFAKDGGAQLDFVYKNSAYYEPSHKRYPIYRIVR